jgi:hypothetical protein
LTWINWKQLKHVEASRNVRNLMQPSWIQRLFVKHREHQTHHGSWMKHQTSNFPVYFNFYSNRNSSKFKPNEGPRVSL